MQKVEGSRILKAKFILSLLIVAASIISYGIISYRHFKLDANILSHFYIPSAAESIAVPAIAMDIKTMANSHQLQKFMLSQELQSQTLIYQRVIEFLYPVREDDSPYLFSQNQNTPRNCVKIDELREASLYECK